MINEENTTTIPQLIQMRKEQLHKQAQNKQRNLFMNSIREDVSLKKQLELEELFEQQCSLEDDSYIDYLIEQQRQEELAYFQRQINLNEEEEIQNSQNQHQSK